MKIQDELLNMKETNYELSKTVEDLKSQLDAKQSEIENVKESMVEKSEIENVKETLKSKDEELLNAKETIKTLEGKLNGFDGKLSLSKEDYIALKTSGLKENIKEMLKTRISGETVDEINQSIEKEMKFVENVKETIGANTPGSSLNDEVTGYEGIASKSFIKKNFKK